MSSFGDLTAPKVEQTGPSGGDEFVYVDISSIDNQAKRIVDPKHLTPDAAPSRARQRLRKGDVLVSMTRPNLNAVAIVPPDLDGAIGSTGFHVLRANVDVEPHWLYYAVQSSSFVKAMCDLVQGALYPAVRPKDIREFAISPPPLVKQREIVAELEEQFSRLDEAVANLQRVKANLKRYKASVLKAAVEGRLVETEGGWRQSTLGEEGKIIGGFTKNQKRNDLPLKLPYLRVANVYANELRLDEIEYIGVAERELEKLLLLKGDLLVVEGNGSPDQIGRVALWNDAIPNCVHQNHLIKARFEEAVLPEWALIWMLSPVGRHEIEQVSASTSGLHTLSVRKVSRLPIGVPPKKEQARIVAEVDRHLSIAREVEAEVDTNLQRAQALRQATLAKAFCASTALAL
ncbi:MAG: restriction endonuclease subunit S [Giesbergeria sp.]